MDCYDWVPSSCSDELPSNAVVAGNDKDGQPIYIGTTKHNGDELPVKIIPGRREAFASYNSTQISISNYMVLVRNLGNVERKMCWEKCVTGNIPEGAIPGGKTARGETLFIGRTIVHGNTYSVGKVHPSHGCLYVPYDGTEISFKEYEVLVQK